MLNDCTRTSLMVFDGVSSMELSLKRHLYFRSRNSVVTRSQAPAIHALHRRNAMRFLLLKCHFAQGFGKLDCAAGKICEDDGLRSASKSPVKYHLPLGRI